GLEAGIGRRLVAQAVAPPALDRLQVPQDRHADGGLALALAAAVAAGGGLRNQRFDDRRRQGAVGCLVLLGDGHGLAGFVVEGLPAPVGAGLGEGHERQGEQQQGNELGTHGGASAGEGSTGLRWPGYTASASVWKSPARYNGR